MRFDANPRVLHRAVADYFSAAMRDRASAMFVASPPTFDAVIERMVADGNERSAIHQHIAFVDVHDALRDFMHGTTPDLSRLRESLTGTIERARCTDGRCWIYGEMANTLCNQENHAAALQVERLWNGMAHKWPGVRVLCGYAAATFQHDAMQRMFHDICAEHTDVVGASCVTTVGTTIYLVDDDPGVRLAVSRMLEAFGYLVESFESAERFLADADLERGSCVILDVQLPGLGGPQLQDLLNQRAPELPIIAISGRLDNAVEAETLQHGATIFLRKPLRATTLLAAVKNALEII